MSSHSRQFVLFVGILGFAGSHISSAHADFYVLSFEPDAKLYQTNPDTGTSHLIGPTGIGSHGSFATGIDVPSDLAMSLSGNLYASSSTILYKLDRSTANATQVGSFNLANGRSMVGLTFGTNSTLYGVDQATNSGGLYSINTTTGAATLLVSTSYGFTGDVATLDNSTFYATQYVEITDPMKTGDHLIKITAGGSTTDLGLIAPNQHIPGLDFDSTGRLIAASQDGFFYNIANYQTTPIVTSLGKLPSDVKVAGTTNIVPEPSSGVLFGVALITIVAVTATVRQVTQHGTAEAGCSKTNSEIKIVGPRRRRGLRMILENSESILGVVLAFGS